MATFVQVSNEDPALHLAALIANINFGAEKKEEKEKQLKALQTLATQQQYVQLIDQGFFPSLEKILAADAKDLATAFNITFSLLLNLDAEQASKQTSRLAESLTKDTTNPVLKLKLLSTLFNLLGAHQLRHMVFLHLLQFALSTNETSAFTASTTFQPLDQWIKEWKLSAAQTAQLYHLAAKICQVNHDSASFQQYLRLYFQALEQADAASISQAKEPAVHVAKSAIESPVFSEVDTLLNLKVMKQLQNDAEHSALYELLRIVTFENVTVYQKFYESTGKKYLEKAGLSHEKVLKKMRVMTICSLGEDAQELPYATLLEKLELKDGAELEEVLIEGVSSGHIDAKIDQERQVVFIGRVTARSFQAENWKKLATKLENLKTNVRNVLDNLSVARAQK